MWTEETLAGDARGRECPHDDVEIRPRIGTMQMSEDRVPSMNIESPHGRGVSSLPGATGSLLPVKFPARLYCLLMDPRWVLGRLQPCGSTRPLRGTLPDGSVPVMNRIGNGRLTYLKLLEMFVQWCRLGALPGWCSIYTLPAPMAPLLQVAPLARVRRRLQVLKKSRNR